MRLGVNVDHIATVRQARRGRIPDPVEAALACERSGADSIVCHLREDRRHIQDRDLPVIKRCVRRLNLEMGAHPEIVRIACRLKPDQATLVPERRQELTTEGGLDVARQAERLRRVIAAFQARAIDVSLFIDPSAAQVRAAAAVGTRIVELHTGAYANARTASQRRRALAQVAHAAAQAHRCELAVAAGHGLDYDNVRAVAKLTEIEELNIGFSIISRALWVGLEKAVRQMKALVG